MILNSQGLKGMTLSDVATNVGLITTSVTYYFKRKEALAAACMLRSIERHQALLTQAAAQPTTEERLTAYVRLYFDLLRDVRLGSQPPLAVFTDMHILKPEYADPVKAAYRDMFAQIGDLFRSGELSFLDRKARSARAFLLLSVLLWSVVVVRNYDAEDYDRIGTQLLSILLNGLAADAQADTLPDAIALPPGGQAPNTRDAFLVAATQLINEQGYHGASVDRICARLNVTKGTFYHYNDAKDDVVTRCFERTLEIIRQALRAACSHAGPRFEGLASGAVFLALFQLSPDGPLLRFNALTALPPDIAPKMLRRVNVIVNRIAGLISDGIADGSIRPVDPAIAANVITAVLNSIAEFPGMFPSIRQDRIVNMYLKPAFFGLLAR